MKEDAATKSVRLQKRILNVETSKIPLPNGSGGNCLKVRGARTSASGGIQKSLLQIRALKAFRRQTYSNALPPIHRPPGQYPPCPRNLFLKLAGLALGEKVKRFPIIKSPSIGCVRQIRIHFFPLQH